MSKMMVMAKQGKAKSEVTVGPFGFRLGSKYAKVAGIASEKPRELDDLVKVVARKTGIKAQCVVYDIRVLCDPNNKSNGHKTRNKFGAGTANGKVLLVKA